MELDAFQLFMIPEIIEDITRRTNNTLEQVRQSKAAVLADSTWKNRASLPDGDCDGDEGIHRTLYHPVILHRHEAAPVVPVDCQCRFIQNLALPILSSSSRKDDSNAVFPVSIGLQV